MPKFQYKAQNMSGKMIEGVYDAPNQQAVIDMIRQKSFYHLDIKEIVEGKDLKEIGIFARIGIKDIAIFCRQFSSILKAGVPLIQCLSMLGDQIDNKALKIILKNVCEEVQKGSSLSQAMSLHENKFPPLLINMIAAGELSGTLDNSLEVMSEHFEKDHKLQQKVKSAMIYPMVLCVVTIGVVWLLLVKVVPTFVGMFESAGADLPTPTKILIGMSEFLQHNGLLVFGGIVTIGILIKLYLSSDDGQLAFHKRILTMPLIGNLQTKTIAARFARTLATLMTTGVSITESLKITGRVLGNAYAKNCIKEVEDQVKQGKGLYVPIKASGLFPPMIENMVMLGEESGTLDSMLQKSADFYEDEVDRAVQNLTSMMEPAIIVVLGGVVGFIVLSIALPMFDMMQLAGQ
ncbi:MAG: type II secretion system F family protein [Anaerocolumna sp.]